MQQNFSKWSAVALFCVLALTLVTAPGAAQDRPALGPSGITYDPAIDYERATLTLSGMGQVWQQSVADGSRVVFDLVGPEGERFLRDGEYTWELSLVPLRDGGAARRDDVEAGFEGAREIPGLLHSGYFTIRGGQVQLAQEEPVIAPGTGLAGDPQTRDQQILDDLIVVGSACVGQDCINGEVFGFDTIKVKENNLRIKFQDTSNSASFPTNDWQITANESSNGGANKFSIDDIDGSRTPFTIEAGAPSHSLYVDDAGRIGLGTSTPVVEVHIKDGDTPTLRLEQDGSSGFTQQTWDVAGNETNFFIRDATSGSKLPFRIQPGAASNTLYVGTSGIGAKTTTPSEELHVVGTAIFDDIDNGAVTASPIPELLVRASGSAPTLLVEDASADTGNDIMLHLDRGTAGNPILRYSGQFAPGGNWDMTGGNLFSINDGDGGTELTIDTNGNVVVTGSVTAPGGHLPDYVFESDYELMSLADLANFVEENRHLPNVPSVDDMKKAGGFINMNEMQNSLLEKVEELVLYTLEQQEEIDELKQANAELLKLQERLAALEVVAGVN